MMISIRDPLALTAENAEKEPLLIDSYVRVEIKGDILPSVVRLDRDLLRDGNHVWILTPEGTLSIRPVEVVLSERDTVLIGKGIDPNDQIITTDLTAAVEGMSLRLREEKPESVSADDPNNVAPAQSAMLGDPNRIKPTQRAGRSE